MQQLQTDDIQGIILYAYGHLPYAAFFLVNMGTDSGKARGWLAEATGRVTTAGMVRSHKAVNLALTKYGLAKLGLPKESLPSFGKPFEEGIISPHRTRMLGDENESAPENWAWGNEPENETLDLLLMLYGESEAKLQQVIADEKALLERYGLSLMAELDTEPIMHTTSKEHFGFRDGVSQPAIEGYGRKSFDDNTVKAGEIILGYLNEYDKYPDSPAVPAKLDHQSMLATNPDFPEMKDLGKNGSYLIFRQLAQHVPSFWQYAQLAEKQLKQQGFSDDAVKIASKMVGRWPSGAPMATYPSQDQPDKGTDNDFGFAANDAHGLKCPVGSHIRRANPRDTFTDDPKKSIKSVKKNRIMRRGRGYGKPVDPSFSLEKLKQAAEDGTERGLHFICFNTNISRQFELIQQQWLNNPKFLGLYKEVDPLLGYRADMVGESFDEYTIPCEPLRQKLNDIPRFVTVKGGAYFFMPGIRAMYFLSNMKS